VSEIHRVECDRCGKEKDMEKPSELFNSDDSYNLPAGWVNVAMDFAGACVDLCSDCDRQRKAAQEQFMEQSIRSKVDLNDEELQANISKKGAKDGEVQ